MGKINLSRYKAVHGSAPKPNQTGTWCLENMSSQNVISRTCTWDELSHMSLEFYHYLLP